MLPSYFHEIGKIPLLTAEEEVELSERLQAGCEAARHRMIAANLRLVVRIAAEFSHLDLPVGDLISEGNLGLIKAVERFRGSRGSRFATYASWWIRQAMHRALAEQGHAMRLTPLAMSKLTKLRRASSALADDLGREPTDDELAEELGLSSSAVEHLRNVTSRPASMDAMVAEDGGATFGSLLADETAEDPHEVLSGKDAGLEALKVREREVLVRRFGLEGRQPMKLEDIGCELGCTRERVRQIQDEALKRLRRAFAQRRARQFLRVVPGTSRAVRPRPVAALPARRAA
jgi:RNA polymerase primary sigma factor